MRLKFRFNIVDYIIFLVVVLLSAVLIFRYSEEIKQEVLTGTGSSNLVITVKTHPIRKEYSDNFGIGKSVINYDTGINLGTVSDVSLHNISDVTGVDGSFVYAIVRIKSHVKKENDHYIIDDEKFLVNEVTSFAQPGIYFEGNILSLEHS